MLQVTNCTPSLQVVVMPTMFPNSPVREAQLHWLKALGPQCSPVFWQSWFAYPHTGGAELHQGEWDFSHVTPLLQDMLAALGPERELSLQFGTIPQWMLTGAAGAADATRAYPTDVEQIDWNADLPCSGGGSKWNATSHRFDGDAGCVPRNMTAVAEYFARFMRFYTKGGFTDSAGSWHTGYNYSIPWFEYGNEMEYGQSPIEYTRQHDAVAGALRVVDGAPRPGGQGCF